MPSLAEDEASDFLRDYNKSLLDGEHLDCKGEARLVDVVMGMFNWSSEDADPTTGRVTIAVLDTTDQTDALIDSLVFRFLHKSEEFTYSQVVKPDGELTDSFSYRQFRLSGKIRDVNLERMQQGAVAEYSVKYAEIGEYYPDPERLLNLGHLLLSGGNPSDWSQLDQPPTTRQI